MTDVTPLDPAATVRAFWEHMQARDWDAARSTLADDVQVWWPASGERFDDADQVVAVNRAYPDGWFITVRSVIAAGEDVLAWVEVPFFDQMMWCAQRATVRDGRIVASIDLWTTENQDDAPDWRASFRTSPTQLDPVGPPDPARTVSTKERP